jgi:FtsZ-binding cell division protein ZapB
MTSDLLLQLEQKVANAIEVIELLRLQVEELEGENMALKTEHDTWRKDLSALIKRFDQIDSTPARVRTTVRSLHEETEEEFMTV